MPYKFHFYFMIKMECFLQLFFNQMILDIEVCEALFQPFSSYEKKHLKIPSAEVVCSM